MTGLSTFLDVLNGAAHVLEAEQQYADSTTTISTNLVQLYKALGGGWETSFPRGSPAEQAPKGVGFPVGQSAPEAGVRVAAR